MKPPGAFSWVRVHARVVSEHARPRRRHAVHGPLGLDDEHTLGEEALHFTRWFAKSKYHLMGQFLGELQRPAAERDAATLRDRFCRAITHAHRVHQARGFVTLLLALGVLAAAATAVLNTLGWDAETQALDRAAAYSASASVVLIAMRLLLDRYLERADVAATFLAMQLVASRPA